MSFAWPNQTTVLMPIAATSNDKLWTLQLQGGHQDTDGEEKKLVGREVLVESLRTLRKQRDASTDVPVPTLLRTSSGGSLYGRAHQSGAWQSVSTNTSLYALPG